MNFNLCMTHHEALRSAPRKIRRRGHYDCQLCVTSIIPFYASRFHNNRSLNDLVFDKYHDVTVTSWTICSISIYDFDRTFLRRVSPVAYILTSEVWCSWTMVDSSKTGTNLRATMVSSSLSVFRECDTRPTSAFLSMFAPLSSFINIRS